MFGAKKNSIVLVLFALFVSSCLANNKAAVLPKAQEDAVELEDCRELCQEVGMSLVGINIETDGAGKQDYECVCRTLGED